MATYQQPGFLVARVLNPAMALAVRLGLGLRGAHLLTVRGRVSGTPRSTPVNLLEYEGVRYLVAPRGETHWARNLRAAGEGEVRLGRRRQPVQAVEIPDADKPAILRAFLRRWAPETGRYFDGLTADASDDDLRRIAPDHPVFRLD